MKRGQLLGEDYKGLPHGRNGLGVRIPMNSYMSFGKQLLGDAFIPAKDNTHIYEIGKVPVWVSPEDLITEMITHMAWVTEFVRVGMSYGGYKSFLVRGSTEPQSSLLNRHVVDNSPSPTSKEKFPTTTEREARTRHIPTAAPSGQQQNTDVVGLVPKRRKRIDSWKVNHVGERNGEAKNPEPNSYVRIAFGNVSSYILHQDYINTAPCDALGMFETRLNDAELKLVQESLENLSWSFVPRNPPLQWRAGVEGRHLDASPGRVGFSLKKHISHVWTALLLDECAEERRRVVLVTTSLGDGFVPFRLFQIYGYARAKDDPERMDLNEKPLNKVFKEANACVIPTSYNNG